VTEAVITPPEQPLVPLFLSLARDGGRGRVLDLDPAIDAARFIRRAEPLRHNALTAERAGVLVEDRAVAVVVLVEDDARMRAAQQISQEGLAVFNRCPAQIPAVEFEQIEGAEHGGAVMPVS